MHYLEIYYLLLLPNLSNTLSLILQHFFPLAGNLHCPPHVFILYKDIDIHYRRHIVFVFSPFLLDSSLLKCHITIGTGKNLIFDTCDCYVIYASYKLYNVSDENIWNILFILTLHMLHDPPLVKLDYLFVY